MRLARTKSISFLNQALLIGSLDPQQATLQQSLLPVTSQDVHNVLHQLGTPAERAQEDLPSKHAYPKQAQMRKALKEFFTFLDITALRSGQKFFSAQEDLLPVTFLSSSMDQAHHVQQLLFQPIQSEKEAGSKEETTQPIALGHLEIANFSLRKTEMPIPFRIT